MPLQALLQQVLFLFGIGFGVANARALTEYLRFRGRRRTSLLRCCVRYLTRLRCATAGAWLRNHTFTILAKSELPSSGSRRIMFTIS